VNKSIVFKAPINGFQYLQGDAFNYYKIISGQTVNIPENTEYLLTQDLELIGDIEIIGDLVLIDHEELNTPHILTTTSDVTLTNGNDYVMADGTINTVTITLPALADSPNKIYYIKAIDTTS